MSYRRKHNVSTRPPASAKRISGNSPSFAVPDPKPVPSPWIGTACEVPLVRMKIPGAGDGENTQFRNYIYGEVIHIGRLFRKEVPSGPPFRPLKDAAKMRSIAGGLKRLATKVRPFKLPLAQELDLESKFFDGQATELIEAFAGLKRHSRDPKTERILLLMVWIRHNTGKWHDTEFVEMLNLVGLNHISPDTLRTLRARTR